MLLFYHAAGMFNLYIEVLTRVSPYLPYSDVSKCTDVYKSKPMLLRRKVKWWTINRESA